MKYSGKIILIVFLALAGFVFIKSKTNTPLVPQSTSITKQGTPTTGQAGVSKGQIPAIPFSMPEGFTIRIFAQNLGRARDLQFSPGGTLLVSDPDGNRVIALPDKNNDGIADENKVIINGENHVHGLAFYQDKLFVADVNRVVRYNWDEQGLSAARDKTLFSLPENSDHNNRTIAFSQDGKMFISVGSTCNICRQTPETGGSVYISNSDGVSPHVFARGLRNAAFITINPKTDDLWGTEMGRDYLGDNLPPDEINIVSSGNDYGWPDCYGDRVWDRNFSKAFSDPCVSTTPPIYQIPAHSAPLGLVFINSSQFPNDWQGDLLVSYHGSWNRSVATGFKVVRLNVSGDTITGSEDFLTGFLRGSTNNSALGRPVDLTFDSSGNLYLSDDRAGTVYIIQKSN